MSVNQDWVLLGTGLVLPYSLTPVNLDGRLDGGGDPRRRDRPLVGEKGNEEVPVDPFEFDFSYWVLYFLPFLQLSLVSLGLNVRKYLGFNGP